MGRKHGKDTVVKVNSVDLSQYTNESELPRGTDTHDTTHYGDDAHEFDAGLNTATFTMGGTYDSTASTGPRAALLIVYALNAAVPVIRQPEGTGSGKPQDSFNAILTNYTESNPVADMIKWKADFQVTGDINAAAQAA
jgi:hypothetical protein